MDILGIGASAKAIKTIAIATTVITIFGTVVLSIRYVWNQHEENVMLKIQQGALKEELDNQQKAINEHKVYIDKTNVIITDLHKQNAKINEQFKGSDIVCTVVDFQKIFNEVIL